MFAVIEVGLGVEIAVGAAYGKVAHGITHVDIDAHGAGILEVLVLPRLMKLVHRLVLLGGTVVGDGHERNHVLHLIIIACDGQGEAAGRHFAAEREVVARLRTEVSVAEIEVGAVHLADVAIVLLLGCRCLEALRPSSTQAQPFRGRDHGRELGRQVDAELAVAVETEAAGELQQTPGRILVLNVERLGIIGDGAAVVDAHGGSQPVVAHLEAGAEAILGWQIEDAFEVSHRAPLVALQVALVGEIGEIVGEAPVGVVAVDERRVGEDVVVGVAVPIDVEGDDSTLRGLPLAAHGCRCVAIGEVVGLDVDGGIFARRTVDALAVDAALGVERELGQGRVVDALCQLPVGVAVDGHVARIVDGELGLPRVFVGRVLPSVAVLQLEVGQRRELADGEAYAVVLAPVVVAAAARGVLEQEAVAVVLTGDDVDHAGNGIGTIEGRRCALDNLDALDARRVDEAEVVLPTVVAVQALAVDQYKHIGIAESVHLHLRAHVVLVEGEAGGEAGQDVLDRASAILLQFAARDDLGLHGHVLQPVLSASTGDDYLFQT